MDQAFFDQLDHWHRQEQFQQIIDAIEAIPAEQRSYASGKAVQAFCT